MTSKQILDQAKREELIAVDLIARAVNLSRRKVLRDWKQRGHPVTKIGRTVMLSSALVLKTYFPHDQSGRS